MQSTTKTTSFNNAQILSDIIELPNHEQWHLLELNRLFMQERSLFLSYFFRIAATAGIMFYAPIFVTLIWVILSFSLNIWMRRLSTAYDQLLNEMPAPVAVSAAMQQIVNRYQIGWGVNFTIWALFCLITHIWVPENGWLLCAAILNAFMYLSIFRISMKKALLSQLFLILITAQFTFPFLRLIFQHNDVINKLLLTNTIYIGLTCYLLWIVSQRYILLHQERLDLGHLKLELAYDLLQNKKKLREEQQVLRETNNIVQQFYSGAAHDLRQPVYAMEMYADMLADDPSKAPLLLPRISQSCKSINNMFNALFDYQQMYLHDEHLPAEEISIEQTFANLHLQFEPFTKAKNINIFFRPIKGTIKVKPLHLTRILSNLINNAIKYTQSGDILITAKKRNSYISFEIWDSGIGIEKNVHDAIFNEFYRVNNSNIETNGLGLGLSIVRQLVSQIEGAGIVVKSRLGRGSVFKFRLPIHLYSENEKIA